MSDTLLPHQKARAPVPPSKFTTVAKVSCFTVSIVVWELHVGAGLVLTGEAKQVTNSDFFYCWVQGNSSKFEASCNRLLWTRFVNWWKAEAWFRWITSIVCCISGLTFGPPAAPRIIDSTILNLILSDIITLKKGFVFYIFGSIA